MSSISGAIPVSGESGFLSRERIVAGPTFNRWLVPPAALAIHLCIGMAYGFSVFWLPMTKQIANPDAAGLLIAQFYPSPNYNADQTKDASDGYNWAAPIAIPLDWSEWNVRPDWDVNKSNRITARMRVDSCTNPAPSRERQPSSVGDGTTVNVETLPSKKALRLPNEAWPY